MIRHGLLVAMGAFTLVACSSTPENPRASEPVASSSEDITTDDVIARAQLWVNAKLLYCQAPNHAHDYDTACSSTCNRQDNPAWDPYRSDCSGFVSWSWGLPAPGRVTGQFAPADNSVSHAINGIDLEPGDALNYPADHIILFVKWITKGSTAEFYEEPGCSSSTPYAHSFTSSVTINGSSVHVSYEGMTFTAIRYNGIQPPNAAPTGYLDSATCDSIDGWSQDPDAPASPLTIDLTFDAPTGQTGSGTLKRTANVYRADLCKPLGTCNHAYSVPMPLGLQDGTKHTVYAYGTDTSDSSLQLLTNAPKSFTCQPPAIPQGIKRHVINPDAMTAWKFDGLLDVAKEPLTAVQAITDGPDLPASPTVVIADDGSPSVWVVDTAKDGTQVRRHVINPTSMTQWGFAAKTWPAAKVNALAQGIDWPAAPFVVQGVGSPGIYLMDAIPQTQGSDAGTNNGGGGGCNTSGSSTDGAWLFALAGVLAARRRR
jgi:MYXO-CTERM domain-containing protein